MPEPKMRLRMSFKGDRTEFYRRSGSGAEELYGTIMRLADGRVSIAYEHQPDGGHPTVLGRFREDGNYGWMD